MKKNPKKASDFKKNVIQSYKDGKKLALKPVLARYMKDFNLSKSEATQHIEEMRKFLALSVHSQTRYVILGPVDHAWHTFLLFTREYLTYCIFTVGKFIHHTPGEAMEEGSAADSMRRYQQLLKDYESVFGTKPPPNIWPKLERNEAAKPLSGDCETCSPYTPPCE